jgi:hypothetical protein
MFHFAFVIFLFFSFFIYSAPLPAISIKKAGLGSLVEKEGSLILSVKGSPYERGYQHGTLLKEKIQYNIAHFIDHPSASKHPRTLLFKEKLPSLLPFISPSILEELQGLAEGSSVELEKILLLNLFPEMFHCSAIAVQGDATADGKLYHVRALDYSMGAMHLKHSAILMIAQPQDALTYLSVSYAGFIGCITGMNEQKIAIGEIGGAGYGSWEGIPMAFLIKQALETSSSLEEVKKLFSSSPRTCEYYYLISDGNQDKAVGVYATPYQIQFIESGSSYALLAPPSMPTLYKDNGLNEKYFISPLTLTSSEYQVAVHSDSKTLVALFHRQPKDCIVMTGFAHPQRYPHLIEDILSHYGSISPFTLQKLLNEKTTLSSNLHNAIFLPSELKVWVSHIGKQGEPAYTQNYTFFDMVSLLKELSFY